MSISELINQHGIGIYIGCVITGILSLVLLFMFLFFIFGLLTFIIEKGFSYFYGIELDTLRYVQNQFDKVEKDTANNSVICNELRCQKSAKDSSRK